MTTVKTCTVCHQTKPITEFGPKKTGAYGVQARCRECYNKHYRNWKHERREENPGPGRGKVMECRRCRLLETCRANVWNVHYVLPCWAEHPHTLTAAELVGKVQTSGGHIDSLEAIA